MTSLLLSSTLLRIVSTAAMLAAFGAQPALAADNKTTTVDLRIGVAFSETIGPGDSHCPAIGHITGSGYSTELGAVGIRSTDCVVPDDATFSSFQFFSYPRVTLTTRNGDEIWGTYKGTATGSPPPIASISATLSIAGGTGRYRNASGSATIEGVENIATVPAVGVLVISGKLSY